MDHWTSLGPIVLIAWTLGWVWWQRRGTAFDTPRETPDVEALSALPEIRAALRGAAVSSREVDPLMLALAVTHHHAVAAALVRAGHSPAGVREQLADLHGKMPVESMVDVLGRVAPGHIPAAARLWSMVTTAAPPLGLRLAALSIAPRDEAPDPDTHVFLLNDAISPMNQVEEVLRGTIDDPSSVRFLMLLVHFVGWAAIGPFSDREARDEVLQTLKTKRDEVGVFMRLDTAPPDTTDWVDGDAGRMPPKHES